MKARYELLTDDLIEHIAGLSDEDQSYWLVLDSHPDFKGFWRVQCLKPYFQFDFEDIIGPYRALAPSRLNDFLDLAEEGEYQIAFTEDPLTILDYYESLKQPPPFAINASEPDTVNGFFPWQIVGFNKLRDPDNRFGIARWDTGTGKTILMGMLTRWHLMTDPYEMTLCVVKKNNRVGTARKFEKLFNLDSHVIMGTPEQRTRVYDSIYDGLDGGPQVAITNYENFINDEDYLKSFFQEYSMLVHWDEMASRLRSRGTQRYNAVGRSLYTSWTKPVWRHKRPPRLRQYEYMATPIENNPADHFNCVRLMDPDIYGTIEEFESQYVSSVNFFSKEPEGWHNLVKMGLKTAHVTHDVSKDDPEVAKYFPKVLEEAVQIDWDPRDREIYDIITGRAAELIEEDFSEDSILTVIGVMQMLCDAPSMVNDSADNWMNYLSDLEGFTEMMEGGLPEPQRKGSETASRLLKGLKRRLTDTTHTKLLQLRLDLTEDYAKDKFLVFTGYNDLLLPKLSNYLTDWGVKHVVYRGTDKQRQSAIDQFEASTSCKVFLSSDAGADSIDLPTANHVIHYDLPWLWSRKIQRQNRAHRVVSRHDFVRYRSYIMPDSIEERKEELIMLRAGYHDAVFKGQVKETSFSARLTRGDLVYMLTGVKPEAWDEQ